MKVSIIVPVYNVQEYLEKCINSIIVQMKKEYELIIVNDGSTDNSSQIISEFKKKYSWIKVLNKSNGGLSSARNAGLKVARGEYVIFIDSDDFIDQSMINSMYNRAIATSADLVVCKFNFYYGSNNLKEHKVSYNNQVITPREALDYFLLNRITGHAWNKLIKRDLLQDNKIEFPYGMLYEDAPTIFNVLKISKRIAFVNKAFYNYVQRENSITKKSSLKTLWDHFHIINVISTWHSSNSKVIKNYYLYTQIYYSFGILSKVDSISPEEFKVYLSRTSEIMKNLNIYKVLLAYRIPLKGKIKSLLAIYKLNRMLKEINKR